MRLLRRIADRTFRAMGYTVVPSWKLPDLPMEKHLLELFRHLGIRCVFDVGANAGQYRDFLRNRVGFEGEIHSFEPLQSMAKLLLERAKKDPVWHIHSHALGNQNAVLEINVMERDSFSSFLDPNTVEATDFAESNTVKAKEMVSVRRLDDVVKDWQSVDLRSTYLKVDTQGFDLEVLRGAKNFLQSLRGLQIELSVVPIYKGTPAYLDVLRQLNDWGFHISGLFPISHDSHLRCVEFDCVMVSMNRR